MFKFPRAAFAAAFALASFAFAAPAVAADGRVFDHGAVNPAISPLGLNSAAPVPAAATAAPAAASAAAAPAAQASVGAFQHMVGLANVPAPQGGSLDADVVRLAAVETRGAEQDCLANAVYFEARGESLEGQLAVAEVVHEPGPLRPLSGDLCGVVVQRGAILLRPRRRHPGRGPQLRRLAPRRRHRPHRPGGRDRGCWRRTCSGITPIMSRPRWGRRLARTSVIGAHIFYR